MKFVRARTSACTWQSTGRFERYRRHQALPDEPPSYSRFPSGMLKTLYRSPLSNCHGRGDGRLERHRLDTSLGRSHDSEAFSSAPALRPRLQLRKTRTTHKIAARMASACLRKLRGHCVLGGCVATSMNVFVWAKLAASGLQNGDNPCHKRIGGTSVTTTYLHLI